MFISHVNLQTVNNKLNRVKQINHSFIKNKKNNFKIKNK